MDWDDLKVFIFVAKSNNVTEAGISLKVSASTVSRKIAALEEALGTVLFSKKTNGYFLTEAGRALLPLALETEERFKLIERQMSQPGDRMAGQVRIDCPELMGTHLIIPQLAVFHDQYPEISFDFINSAVSSKLTQSHSDIIIRLRRPENGNFTMRRVGTLMQGLFCSKAYADANGLPAEPADLKHHSLIGWTEEMSYMPLAQWLSKMTGEQKLWMRVSNLNAQLNNAVPKLQVHGFVGGRFEWTTQHAHPQPQDVETAHHLQRPYQRRIVRQRVIKAQADQYGDQEVSNV